MKLNKNASFVLGYNTVVTNFSIFTNSKQTIGVFFMEGAMPTSDELKNMRNMDETSSLDTTRYVAFRDKYLPQAVGHMCDNQGTSEYATEIVDFGGLARVGLNAFNGTNYMHWYKEKAVPTWVLILSDISYCTLDEKRTLDTIVRCSAIRALPIQTDPTKDGLHLCGEVNAKTRMPSLMFKFV